MTLGFGKNDYYKKSLLSKSCKQFFSEGSGI